MAGNFWDSVFGANIPTVTYCEIASEGIIARPGYFISNIGYILIGIYLLTRSDKIAKGFGLGSIAVGVFSGIYDASFRFNAQVLDLMAMFVFIDFLLILNLFKLRIVKSIRVGVLISLVLALMYFVGIVFLQGSSGRILFGILVVLVIATEYLLSRRGLVINHKYFNIALISFIVGFLIWILDASQIWCSPIDFLNGRAIYHYITAVTMYLLYLHNRNKFLKR